MGIGLGSRCKTYDARLEPCVWTTNEPEAPDVSKFMVIKMEQVGYNIVVYINYPNCSNYEGNKICVYRNADFTDFIGLDKLDPHFTDVTTKISPFARFEPTKEGWDMAVKLTRMI